MLLITGISLGNIAEESVALNLPAEALLAVTFASAISLTYCFYQGYAVLFNCMKVMTFLLLGVSLVIFHADKSQYPEPLAIEAEKSSITGFVSMVERLRGDRQRIRLSAVPDQDWPISTAQDLRLITSKDQAKLMPGDVITGHVRLNPPLPQLLPNSFDFAEHARRQGYGATGFMNEVSVEGGGRPAFASRLRFSIQERLYQKLDDDNAAIASALLVGLRGGISPEIREAFRASGLSHLLAISGLHMALFWGTIMALIRAGIAAFPHFASRHPSLKIAAILAFPFGLFYLVISGMPVSAVRAFLMLALFMFAILLTRRGVTLHHVALAAIGILCLDPNQLTQPAFQMSFAAVFALVAGWMAISAKAREPNLFMKSVPAIVKYAVGIMVGSVLAGFATSPFVLHHFGVTSLWSVLANLAGMPLMAFVIMPFGAMAMAMMPLGLEGVFLSVMELGLSGLLLVAQNVEALPLSHIAIIPPSSRGLYIFTLALVALVIFKGWGRFIPIMLFGVFMLSWSVQPKPIAVMTVLHQRVLAAVSNGDTALYSRKSATSFERSFITRPFGHAHTEYIGTFLNGNDGLDVITHEAGFRIAMVWRKPEFEKACFYADFVVVMRPMNVRSCQAVTIAPHNIYAHGGVLVTASKDYFRLHYVDGTKQDIRRR